MTKIVIDTNIVFSAFLNTNSRIGQILITGNKYFDFYAPEYLIEEILRYRKKIQLFAKLDDNEFVELYGLIIKNIKVLNHSLIPIEIYKIAETLCQDIDINNTLFVAVSKYVDGRLWSGDLKLLNGLSKKGYSNYIKTEELFNELLELEKNRK